MMKEPPLRGVPSISDRPPSPSRRRRLGCWSGHRMESLILSAGLICTVCAKGIALGANPSSLPWLGMLRIILPDLIFFSAVYLVLRFLYRVHPTAWTARFGLLISIVVIGWSGFSFNVALWAFCCGT